MSRLPLSSDRRVVVAVSLPARDLGAVLIAAGWVLAQPSPLAADPLAVAAALELGVPVRLAVANRVVADRFYRVDRTVTGARLKVGRSEWLLGSVARIVADPRLDESRFRTVSIPPAGSLLCRAGHSASWLASQCDAGADVVVVGTRARLEEELEVRAGWSNDTRPPDRLRDVLRPKSGESPLCGSALLAAGSSDLVGMPAEARLIVLDGSTAIRWLPEMAAPRVVALIDRSSANDTGVSTVLQDRSIAAKPLALSNLGWLPQPGVEALAYEVNV